MEKISILLGKKIIKIELVYDYYHILLSDNIYLNVFNKSSYTHESLDKFINETIIEVKENKNLLLFITNTNSCFCVSLNENDYNGPEVLSIYKNNKLYTIWD